jgi:DNA-binding SARP family transcriptional activator
VLGPLEVVRDGALVSISAPKQRALLVSCSCTRTSRCHRTS